MVIIDHVGTEEQHATVILTDLGKTQDFGEKFVRAFEIFDFQNQMTDSFDSKRHIRPPFSRLST
jgi:hypothetical protein